MRIIITPGLKISISVCQPMIKYESLIKCLFESSFNNFPYEIINWRCSYNPSLWRFTWQLSFNHHLLRINIQFSGQGCTIKFATRTLLINFKNEQYSFFINYWFCRTLKEHGNWLSCSLGKPNKSRCKKNKPLTSATPYQYWLKFSLQSYYQMY